MSFKSHHSSDLWRTPDEPRTRRTVTSQKSRTATKPAPVLTPNANRLTPNANRFPAMPIALLAMLLVIILATACTSDDQADIIEPAQPTLINSDSYAAANFDASAIDLRKFSGSSRYLTSLAIARQYVSTARSAGTPATTAIVASGASLIDAAAAAGLARSANAPVILTEPDLLHITTANVIEAAGIKRVLVLGDQAAVSDQVMAALISIPSVEGIERIAGTTRFDTAARIATAMSSNAPYCNHGPKAALLVAGDAGASPAGSPAAAPADSPAALADVITAGPLSYAMGLPILLTSTQGLPGVTIRAITDLGIEHVVIIGGNYSLQDVAAVEAELRAIGVPSVTKLTAENQFSTSVVVAEALRGCLGAAFDTDTAALISHTSLADGIIAAPMLGQGIGTPGQTTQGQATPIKTTPVLLVRPRVLPSEIEDHLRNADPPITVTSIGGVNSISNYVSAAAQRNPRATENLKLANPNFCRLEGSEYETTAGFPLPSWAASSKGTLRVAVLLVDFPDAPANKETRSAIPEELAKTERYLEENSFGQLDVEFASNGIWNRANKSWKEYIEKSGDSNSHIENSLTFREFVPEIASADSLSFMRNYDTVMIIAPSTHFGGGIAGLESDSIQGQGILRGRKYIRWSVINAHPLEERQDEPPEWWRSAAHELGHNLGLTDLYSYDTRLQQKPLLGSSYNHTWITINTGIMGLRGYLSASQQDTRFQTHYQLPENWTNNYAGNLNNAIFYLDEMLGWSRWQLGWLHNDQVACITKPNFDETITLNPVADPTGVAIAVIPISETQAFVVESRRRLGYDQKSIHRYDCCDGGEAIAEYQNLAQEGVFVYVVNAARDGGDLPLFFWHRDLSGESQFGSDLFRHELALSDYPIMPTGSYSVGSVGDGTQLRISVEADDGLAHVVRLTRTPESTSP